MLAPDPTRGPANEGDEILAAVRRFLERSSTDDPPRAEAFCLRLMVILDDVRRDAERAARDLRGEG